MTSTQSGKIAHIMIGITKLVIMYFLENMVSSTKQKVGLKVILGLSHQFIQMGQLGFNAEENQNDSTLGESHIFQQTNLTITNVAYVCYLHLLFKTLVLNSPVTHFSVHYTCHINLGG